jgi:hypothetical protein
MLSGCMRRARESTVGIRKKTPDYWAFVSWLSALFDLHQPLFLAKRLLSNARTFVTLN